MFVEASDSEPKKWAQSITKRGFHCERGVKVDIFLFTHPIGILFMRKIFQFVFSEVPSLVWEFYTNLRENQCIDTLLETTVMGKQLKITPDLIAHSLKYVNPTTYDRPYPP